MNFRYLTTVLAVIVTSVVASSSAPDAESVLEDNFAITSVTTGKTLTQLATDLVSAQSSMNAQAKHTSAFSVFETAIPSSVLNSISASGLPYVTTSAQPDWFSKLPKDVKSLYLSEQSVRDKVYTSVLKISSTGTSSNPAPKATAEMAIGALAAGALGVVAML